MDAQTRAGAQAHIDSWDDLRYFLAVARSGSLSGAARALVVNHSTVYRRIGGLEESLGARLFERLPRGYALTAVGEELLVIAERIEDEMLAIDRRVLGRDQELCGAVRVTTVEEILQLVAPHLRCFRERYPGITLELDTDQRLLSLTRREADVAVRPGVRPDEPDVVARRLCGLSVGFYAATRYLDTHGRPDGDDFAGHALLEIDRHLDHDGESRLAAQKPAARVVYRSNSMLAQLEGARAGLGIALLPCFMGDRAPELCRLGLHAPAHREPPAVWLLVHGELRQSARVRAFIDFIVEALAGEHDLFEGRCPR